MTFIKGKTPWNKGKKCPQISKGKKGKKRPDMVGNTFGFVKGEPSPRRGEKGKNTSWNKGLRAKTDSRILAGKKHPRYKDGLSCGCKTGYYSADYKKWRISVFQRDDFKCQCCGLVGCYITAHHIKSFAHYPELRYEIDNGVTLCEECHSLTDNYKGKGKKKT